MNIIDIRDSKSYLLGHIPNSINIYYLDLIGNPSKYLNKNDTYYLYCKSGITSKKVVNNLNKLGYHTVNIDGGYNKFISSK